MKNKSTSQSAFLNRNDGFYTDSIGNRGHGIYTYKVCEAGTQTYSNNATMNF